MAPGAGAQPGTGFPGQVVVVHETVLPVGEMHQRAVLQLLGRTPPNHAPQPAALFLRELRDPALALQFQCRCRGGVAGGQADGGQGHHFLGARADGGELFVQVLRRVFGQGFDHRHPVGVEHGHRLRHDAGLVGVHGEAGALPHRQWLEVAAVQQRPGGGGTAFVHVALRVPQRRHLAGGFAGGGAPGHGVQHERVALHLPVVVHAKLGQLGLKRGPVALLAQLQQPVVAQAVFPVAAGHAVHGGAYLLGWRGVQPGLHVPINGQGFQCVAAHAGQQVASWPVLLRRNASRISSSAVSAGVCAQAGLAAPARP
jgi:hypothetical protein